MREETLPLLLVVLVGIPGSGKSTLAHALLSGAPPTGRPWCRISQDVLGSRHRCVRAAQRALESGHHVLVDRCNFDAQQRTHWLQLERRGMADIGSPFDHRLAVFLPVQADEAQRRVLARVAHEGGVDAESMSEEKLSSIVERMQRDLRPPHVSEGFDAVLRLDPTGPRALRGGDVGNAAAILGHVYGLASGR